MSPQLHSRTLLVTGGAGFIGTNFVRYWRSHHPNDRLIVLDALTYAGNRRNLAEIEEQLQFVHGNICDRAKVETILRKAAIDTLVHFAAESHVDRSIHQPDAFIQTNVVGTFILLEAFRHHWQTRGKPESDRFLHVSTDEVYGSLSSIAPSFTETSAYSPNNPYSASKASSDHLVRAYHHTYGIPTLITHCSNNYGAYQFPEKLIPLICLNILNGNPLPIYGNGQNIRDWLYVEDHCAALDIILHQAKVGETYNISGDNEIVNLTLVEKICSYMDKLAYLPIRPARSLITFVTDRPGHDYRYAIDATKLKTSLGWKPRETLETGLQKTIDWYLTHRSRWERGKEQ